MEPHDARLVAALTVLRDGLAPVVDQLLSGLLDNEDRSRLARSFRTVADLLAPGADTDATVVDPTPARLRRGPARR